MNRLCKMKYVGTFNNDNKKILFWTDQLMQNYEGLD